VADGSRQDASSFTTFVQQVTAHGVVVEIEDHPWPLAHPYTGGALASETAWYASLAATFKNNPYVWFGTMNEPQSDYGSAESAISDQEVAIYNAIRNTGNNTIIMMSLLGGGNPGTIGDGYGMTTSDYATMTKIVWDLHHYGWMSNYSQNLATEEATLTGSPASGSGITAAQTIRSADGLVPVIIGEYGNSTTGEDIDPNGDVVVQAVQQSGYGCVAWAWHAADTIGDMLVDGSGNLTAYGQEVASFIGH
jgi:mannan endo-1,4-beta-mannosidase